MLRSMKMSLLAFAAAGAFALTGCRARAGAVGPADHHRLRHGADRSARRQRQADAARHEDLGRGNQRQGRSARASGQARLLRRPEQSFDRARHLHQAARRRQGQSRGQRLRHQHGRAGDAGRDAEEQDVPVAVRARCERRVQVSEILLGAADRPEHQDVLHRGLLPGRAGAESEADHDRARRRGRGVLPQRLRRRPRERQEVQSEDRLRQDAIRRARRTSRRSCARCRRPTPISSSSAPIR